MKIAYNRNVAKDLTLKDVPYGVPFKFIGGPVNDIVWMRVTHIGPLEDGFAIILNLITGVTYTEFLTRGVVHLYTDHVLTLG